MGLPASEQPTDVLLDRVIGYLNFSTGSHDKKFLSDFRQCVAFFYADYWKAKTKSGENACYVGLVIRPLREKLLSRIKVLSESNRTFQDVEQSQTVVQIVLEDLLKGYRLHHSDLLFHQADSFLFNSFFLGRAFEAVIAQGAPWNGTDRIVKGAIHDLNDFIGHRPVATLESHKIEPYSKEYVRPVPVYIQGAGVAEGEYSEIVADAIQVLETTDPNILRAAQFDPGQLQELAIEPRAFEFDHPINRRPNHHFGQWDEHAIGQNGFYQRFVIHQITLDALLSRIDRVMGEEFESLDPDSALQAARTIELKRESSAALAGTMLMASGISGSGPGSYDSNVTLGTLLPIIANYRDEFYQNLIQLFPNPHRKRLLKEAAQKHQPFGGVRQDLNAELSKRRASQMVSCRLASIYARMGYHDAAESQSNVVPMASVRIICKIDCQLSSANLLVDSFRDSRLQLEFDEELAIPNIDNYLEDAFEKVPQVFELLKRGIECGAIVDPWNILGFDGNYSLFPAIENTVVDHRVFDLIEIVEQILYLCSRLWSEAAASDQLDLCERVRGKFQMIVAWWRQFAAHQVPAVDAVDPQDIFNAAELVATALNLWHQGGAEAGDIAFWKNHAGLFDTPKAYALVIDALMQRCDYKTSTALLMNWLSESEYIGLQQGDSSFHDLMFRWISDQRQLLMEAEPVVRQQLWTETSKFYDRLEANAGEYWIVPDFELGKDLSQLREQQSHPENDDIDDYDEEDEEVDEDSSVSLYKAAYEDVVYNDTTDDGNEGVIYEPGNNENESLEDEVDRVMDRLEFLGSIASFWSIAANVPLPKTNAKEIAVDLRAQLAKRREIFVVWTEQATSNRKQLINLLGDIHRYKLPRNGTDPESLFEYDRCRHFKDMMLERAIATCVETENAIRVLKAVIRAVDQLLQPELEASTKLTGAATVERVLAAIILRDRKKVVVAFPGMLKYLHKQPLLYVPLAKGGDPADIVRARVNQSAMLELLRDLPSMGLIVQTYELTVAALSMERENTVGGGAVTEFDQLFQVAYTSIVHSLVQATGELKTAMTNDPNQPSQDISMECENVLFDCIELLTESFLIPWLDHSDTLRLSVLERVLKKDFWKKLEDFIKRYGDGLFTQQFLQISNLRAILHKGVGNWLEEVEESSVVPDLKLFDEIDKNISRNEVISYLTLILEAVIENYSEYRDYNTNTTQSDQGSLLYILLDFLRLRGRYERVCWKLKPVIWAHEILVREQKSGVAKMWRRNLRERVGPEADKYLEQLAKLRKKYSVQMVTIARRLEERFGHPMQIDRLRALVGPSMKNPRSKKTLRTFELLQQETNAFSRSMLGVGMELPAWLAALENEVSQHYLPERLREQNMIVDWIDPVVLPIAELRKQLEQLPGRLPK